MVRTFNKKCKMVSAAEQCHIESDSAELREETLPYKANLYIQCIDKLWILFAMSA